MENIDNVEDSMDDAAEDEAPVKPVRVTRVNYNQPKAEEPRNAEKRVDAVVTGQVIQRKKSFGRKLLETFTGEDVHDAGSYVFFEVLVPATKKLMLDIVNEGLQRVLWGGSNTRRPTMNRQPDYTSYNRYYNMAQERRPNVTERNAPVSGYRKPYDFDDYIIPDRGEADMVLDRLNDLIESFGAATVADLYDLLGRTGVPYTNQNYGWTSSRDMSTSRVAHGYVLNLPRPVPLD